MSASNLNKSYKVFDCFLKCFPHKVKRNSLLPALFTHLHSLKLKDESGKPVLRIVLIQHTMHTQTKVFCSLL